MLKWYPVSLDTVFKPDKMILIFVPSSDQCFMLSVDSYEWDNNHGMDDTVLVSLETKLEYSHIDFARAMAIYAYMDYPAKTKWEIIDTDENNEIKETEQGLGIRKY